MLELKMGKMQPYKLYNFEFKYILLRDHHEIYRFQKRQHYQQAIKFESFVKIFCHHTHNIINTVQVHTMYNLKIFEHLPIKLSLRKQRQRYVSVTFLQSFSTHLIA